MTLPRRETVFNQPTRLKLVPLILLEPAMAEEARKGWIVRAWDCYPRAIAWLSACGIVEVGIVLWVMWR